MPPRRGFPLAKPAIAMPACHGLAEYRLPERLQLSLELDGAPLQLAAVAQVDEQATPATGGEAAPQLLLLSSGELSPFRQQLSERDKGAAAYELHSDGFSLPLAAPVASRRPASTTGGPGRR